MRTIILLLNVLFAHNINPRKLCPEPRDDEVLRPCVSLSKITPGIVPVLELGAQKSSTILARFAEALHLADDLTCFA
eukprot:CAMPEP_0172638706 /NCGR_PEP_ID=MMETSP1068-20121228/215105_1 /TAXON_ID=35684 /ORGANISM="Pseudopedinella elastica, Strain CCMP716" /LENGTH=76 /DNA_ID=CAMNT_0013451659 /DNA_START=85 /DNA_END=312 /DNA_ORIENTATION=-